MSFGIHACWRALLALSKRLNYPNLAVAFETPFYEIVEPSFRDLPVFSFCQPNRSISPVITEPVTVGVTEWEAQSMFLARFPASNDHGNFILVPYSLYVGHSNSVAKLLDSYEAVREFSTSVQSSGDSKLNA